MTTSRLALSVRLLESVTLLSDQSLATAIPQTMRSPAQVPYPASSEPMTQSAAATSLARPCSRAARTATLGFEFEAGVAAALWVTRALTPHAAVHAGPEAGSLLSRRA